MSRVGTAVRLLRGDLVPFLAPAWGAEEWESVEQWQRGAEFPEAVGLLEAAVAERLGHGVRVQASSFGRVSISSLLEAMDLPPGSEVVLPSFSCSALVMAVHQAGTMPVLVDMDEHLNISAQSVADGWGPNVRAVIAPHVGGLWADSLPHVRDLCRDRGAHLIEDAAHALGLVVEGRPAGTSGDAAIFSTGTGKPLFGPGGGLLALPADSPLRPAPLPEEPRAAVEARLDRFLARYRPHAVDRARHVLGIVRSRLRREVPQTRESFRFASHAMSDLEARLALLQLERLDGMIERRRANADRWRSLFDGSPVQLAPAERNTCVKFWARCRTATDASQLRQLLLAHGVETESLWTPLHLRPAFADARRTDLAVTEALWQRVFSLPVRPNLPPETWARAEAAVAELGR